MARRVPGRESGFGQHARRPDALNAFTDALWGAWVKAGRPSYNDFEQRSKEILGQSRRLPASTTQEIEISKLPNVTIQVIPSGTRMRALLGYPITLLRFHDREITDIAYFEQLTSALYLNTPDHASRYAQVLTGLSAEALHPAKTVGYLGRKLRDSR